jgi:hypothetical protein
LEYKDLIRRVAGNKRLSFHMTIIRPDRAFQVKGKREKWRILGINGSHLCICNGNLVDVELLRYDGD